MHTITGVAIIFGIILAILAIVVLKKTVQWIGKAQIRWGHTILVFIASFAASFIIGAMIAPLDVPWISLVATFVTTLLVYIILLKKFAHMRTGKGVAIYFVSNIIFALVSVLIVIAFRRNVFEPFVVSGQSMEPAANKGDYLVINKLSHNFARGDIVVYKHDAAGYVIKRIIGLPGEKIDVSGGTISINDKLLTEPYISGDTQGESHVTLKADEYFLMGDNREHSALDSTTIGPIARAKIVGKVFRNLGDDIIKELPQLSQ